MRVVGSGRERGRRAFPGLGCARMLGTGCATTTTSSTLEALPCGSLLVSGYDSGPGGRGRPGCPGWPRPSQEVCQLGCRPAGRCVGEADSKWELHSVLCLPDRERRGKRGGRDGEKSLAPEGGCF